MVEAGNICIRDECSGGLSGWPGNENFWATLEHPMYYFNGSKTSVWPKFPPMSKPQACWTIAQGVYCRDNVGGKAPTILDFHSEPQAVIGGTNIKLTWKVRNAWAITVKGWCSWCLGNDSEDKPYITINGSNFPDGCYGNGCAGSLVIPGDWKESPKYTFRLIASNGDGTVTKDVELYPSNNILNQTGKALKEAWDNVTSTVIAVVQKIAECAASIGGEIAGKFKDPWSILTQIGGYAAQVGGNFASAGTASGSVVQVACMTALTTAGTAIGAAAFGVGAAVLGPIMYGVGAVTCPLAENAGWSILDTILCTMGVRTNIVKSDNIRLVVSIGEALTKVDWGNVGGWIKGLFSKPPAGSNFKPLVWSNVPPSAVPTQALPSNATVVVGVGSASAAANSLQSTSNTWSAIFGPHALDPNSIDATQKAALEVAGKSGTPLVQGSNILSNINAQALENAGVTNDMLTSFLGSLDPLAKEIYNAADGAKKVCMIIARSVNACPLNP